MYVYMYNIHTCIYIYICTYTHKHIKFGFNSYVSRILPPIPPTYNNTPAVKIQVNPMSNPSKMTLASSFLLPTCAWQIFSAKFPCGENPNRHKFKYSQIIFGKRRSSSVTSGQTQKLTCKQPRRGTHEHLYQNKGGHKDLGTVSHVEPSNAFAQYIQVAGLKQRLFEFRI